MRSLAIKTFDSNRNWCANRFNPACLSRRGN